MKDPVLVAFIKGESGYSGTRFILARWGESLEPFNDMVQKAKVVALARAKMSLEKGLIELSSVRTSLEERAEAYVAGSINNLDFSVYGI